MAEPLLLPAIRGLIGQWTYYICLLRMADVAERISDIAEIHSSKEFRDMLQRRLTDRSEAISEYLLTQEQRFFNSIVVGTYGGNPNWYELAINVTGSSIDPLPEYFEGTLGILSLNGSENLWAIDGQHRVSGIKQAVLKNEKLGNEEICAIFVSGVTSDNRSEDPEGFERTRRLFTTLNKYAKKVDKRDIIALDEDDVVAIVTRFIVDEHEMLTGRIATGSSRSIPVSDKKSFTTIEIVYDVLDIILRDMGNKAWKKFKLSRPTIEELSKYQDRSINFFQYLGKYEKDFCDYISNEIQEDSAYEFRNRDGGNLLFRPIGLLLVARVVRLLMENEQETMEKAIEIVCKTQMKISSPPWGDLLWDVGNHRMITAAPNQKVAKWLLYYIVGGNLNNLKTTGGRVNNNILIREYENIVKRGINLEEYRL